jgi:hypothetical protein
MELYLHSTYDFTAQCSIKYGNNFTFCTDQLKFLLCSRPKLKDSSSFNGLGSLTGFRSQLLRNYNLRQLVGRTHISMLRVGLEPAMPMLGRAKTFRTFNNAAIVIG